MNDGPIYEDFAEEYLDHASEAPYNVWYDRPSVLAMLGDVDGLDVLDVGCGPGLYAEQLVARGARVTGLDNSPTMVRLASERVPEGAFRVHDLPEPLDWIEDDTFDAAIMALVIHHIDDRLAALSEVHRVLKPGGHLVVSTHHPTTDWLRLGGSYFTREMIEETWSRGWQVRYWRQPLTDTFAEFTEAGFLVEDLVETRPHPEMEQHFPDRFEKLNNKPAFINFRMVKP